MSYNGVESRTDNLSSFFNASIKENATESVFNMINDNDTITKCCGIYRIGHIGDFAQNCADLCGISEHVNEIDD